MDEFAIFARALSEAEIKQLCENASGIRVHATNKKHETEAAAILNACLRQFGNT